ncbi:MAG TPA: lysyl oxidase family protein [Nocardioides sp.]|nr:lysyl oxidase family protein [Nocardioides sp.]
MYRWCGPLIAAVVMLTACTGDDTTSSSEKSSVGAPTDGEPTQLDTTSADPVADDLLRPNMRSLAASDLRVVLEDGERRLRFAGWLANLGPGPMVVRPGDRGVCPQGQISVRQIVYRDRAGDGVFQRGRDPARLRRDAGCMLDHPTHDHWHFDAMARYSLRDPEGNVIADRRKVSFCLRDNSRVRDADRVVRRAYFGECGPRSDQGISPGWIDIYGPDLDGQYLVLPDDTPRTTVCMVVTADPRDQLVETDETDNRSVLPLRIRGTQVSRVRGGCGSAA